MKYFKPKPISLEKFIAKNDMNSYSKYESTAPIRFMGNAQAYVKAKDKDGHYKSIIVSYGQGLYKVFSRRT